MGIHLKLSLTSSTEIFTYSSDESSITIGRSSRCEFVIPKDDLSRRHCVLETINGQRFITDLGSVNGVLVNQVRIPANQKVMISESSVIVLAGNYRLGINAKHEGAAIPMAKVSGSETDTFSLELDMPKTFEKRSRKTVRRIVASQEKVRPISQNGEPIKMLVGFLVIVAFVIYHALGT